MPLLCYDSNRTNYNQEGKYKVCINYTKKKKKILFAPSVCPEMEGYTKHISALLFSALDNPYLDLKGYSALGRTQSVGKLSGK